MKIGSSMVFFVRAAGMAVIADSSSATGARNSAVRVMIHACLRFSGRIRKRHRDNSRIQLSNLQPSR